MKKGFKIAVMIMLFSTFFMSCVLFDSSRVSGHSYVAGALRKTYSADLTQAWDATHLAITQLGLETASSDLDGFSGVIKGTLVDTRDYAITVTRIDEKRTEVSVLIGLGDKEASETLHKKVGENIENIKNPAPEPIEEDERNKQK